jgi:hypothetical protein
MPHGDDAGNMAPLNASGFALGYKISTEPPPRTKLSESLCAHCHCLSAQIRLEHPEHRMLFVTDMQQPRCHLPASEDKQLRSLHQVPNHVAIFAWDPPGHQHLASTVDYHYLLCKRVSLCRCRIVEPLAWLLGSRKLATTT